MQVFITRPRQDAEDLADQLRRLGYAPVLAPLMEVECLPPVQIAASLDTKGVQALALTSANGARAAAGLSLPRELPVYAVGDATAEAARQAGFQKVHSARGDAAALAGLIRERLKSDAGAILHLSGETVAEDLKEALAGAGFDYRRAIVYRVEPLRKLPRTLADPLRDTAGSGKVKAIMIFSPRTAETFVRLVQEAGLTEACTSLEAVCISSAAARPLAEMRLRRLRVARTPDRASMLAALAAVRDEADGSS